MIDQQWADRALLDGDETVVRYVGGSHFDPATKRINGGAFDRRDSDRDGLSLTRRGVFFRDDEADRDAIREAVGGRMKLGKTAVFAELSVAGIHRALDEFGQPIAVCADPVAADARGPANPAHALLLGLPFAGQAIGSLTSERAGDRLKHQVGVCFPAISPPAA